MTARLDSKSGFSRTVLSVFLLFSLGFSQVYVTYHWHLQQPIYWPEVSALNSSTYQKAWESWAMNNGHPENDLEQIFGWPDRVAVYQYRVRDAIAGIAGTNGGAHVSYSGCLIENVQSLAFNGSLGYSGGWENNFQEAIGWQTSGGFPKLDIVIFPYHHALSPLIDEEALRKEIQIYKSLYPDIWDNNPSVGFFPPEMSFSERMIKVLDEEGIDWVFVGNNHISRACENFPLILGTAGENCNPPNLADQINPPQSSWFSKHIDRGCTPTNAYPFAYQPHYAQYIDPDSGSEYRVIVVPVAQAMSWTDGYATHGTEDIDQIAEGNDPSHPMLVVLAHDGDNAWGGGYSYYHEAVPNFTSQALSSGYPPTVVNQYLSDHPVDWNDVVHVEDGSWVNADGDFGSPDFINWNWPPVNTSGQVDIANGWAEDIRNWAVITAAQNRVSTAEQIAGNVSIPAVQDPTMHAASPAELAWHFFLPSLTSGYMYYGTSLDMEVKATIACNNAVEHADQLIGDGSADQTPPTIWIPQQWPHNPGEIGFGPTTGYQQVQNPRDFWVWSFVYDVSGLDSVEFCYRLDNDGVNPLTSTQNEVYAQGSEVGEWECLPMTQREFPAENFFNDGAIDFFEMPQYIADQYYIHVNESAIVDEGGVLVDYYVQASDGNGNLKRSPIQHTWVGTGSGSSGGSHVSWEPDEPEAGGTLLIQYDLAQGPLPNSTSPVHIHIGYNGWQGILSPDPAMTLNPENELWEYSYAVPSSATAVDFVFNDGSGTWDNNNGMDWHVTVSGGVEPEGFVMDGSLDDGAQLLGSIDGRELYAAWNEELLYVAGTPAQGTGTDHFILLSDGSGSMTAAPWAKSGQTAEWAAFIGNEEENGWAGWFDQSAYSNLAAGTILEGEIDILSELGGSAETVFIALGAYQSADGGSLSAQVPATLDNNLNMEISEFYPFDLSNNPDEFPDVNQDGSVDVLDVVLVVGIILGDIEPTQQQLDDSDLNDDGSVDVTDIVLLVDWILN